MNDVLSRLNGGEILGLCGIVLGLFALVGGLGMGFAAVMAWHHRRTQLDDMEATLKMEMIQRGMSADDIKQVLESKMEPAKPGLRELWSGFPSARMPKMFGKEAKNG